MLKVKDMVNGFNDADGWEGDDPQGAINLELLKNDMIARSQQYSVPIDFTDDMVKCGGLFSKDDRSCIVLSHPEHKRDYQQFVLFIKQEYGRTYISYRFLGESKLMAKEARKQGARAARDDYASSVGGLGAHLGAAMGNAIGGIGSGKRKEKIEAEARYYDMVGRVISETMSAYGLQ